MHWSQTIPSKGKLKGLLARKSRIQVAWESAERKQLDNLILEAIDEIRCNLKSSTGRRLRKELIERIELMISAAFAEKPRMEFDMFWERAQGTFVDSPLR